MPETTTAPARRSAWKAYALSVGEYLYGIRWKLFRRLCLLLALRGLAALCGLAQEWWQPVCAAVAKVLEAVP